jgi:hypothetical protein
VVNDNPRFQLLVFLYAWLSKGPSKGTFLVYSRSTDLYLGHPGA